MSAENEVNRYDVITKWREGEMRITDDGEYVSYEDYEALRRATVSLETAQELADAITSGQRWMMNQALARFEAEKGAK